jgi:hypothetical protein
MVPSSMPQSTKVWYIIFILPEVKVGYKLKRRFLHLLPRRNNKWPDNGSSSSSRKNARSWKLEKSLTRTFLIITGSRNMKPGFVSTYVPPYLFK